MLQGLLSYVNSFIIAGDVNINLLSSSCDTENYINLLSDFYLEQHVCQPTRVTETPATLIDHVIASKDIPVSSLQQPCGLSDYKVQVADFVLGTVGPLPSIRCIRSFRTCDWEKLRDVLRSAPWHTMDIFDNINDKWLFFCTLLQECLDKFLPLKRVTVHKARRPTPWFNETISANIRAKNKAKRTFERSASDSDRDIYCRLRNELKASIRQAKVDYLKSSMAKAKSCPQMAAQMWARVNSVLGRQEVKEDNKSSLSLDMINDHFQNIAVTKQHRSAAEFNLPSQSTANNFNQFVFPEVSVSTVLSHLSSLDTTKATGPDGLSARFLKEISDVIVEPLTILYNESLRTGVIPLEWKKSHITPVHKGGSTDEATNYRPIAVVSVVVKILEKIVATDLSGFLESTAQLHPHQAAYRSGKSTEDILRVAVDINRCR